MASQRQGRRITVDNICCEFPGLSRVSNGVDVLVIGHGAPGLVLGQGPTTAARYRDEGKGMDAYIIRQWLEPKVVIDDALDKICT